MVFVILSIMVFLLKLSIKLALGIAVAVILFNVAFIWGPQETMEKLHLSEILNDEASHKVEGALASFTSKRDSTGVIDSESLRRVMETSKEKAVEKSGDLWKKQLKKDWSTYFEGLTKEEIDIAIEDTRDIWSNVFTQKEMEEIANGAIQ